MHQRSLKQVSSHSRLFSESLLEVEWAESALPFVVGETITAGEEAISASTRGDLWSRGKIGRNVPDAKQISCSSLMRTEATLTIPA